MLEVVTDRKLPIELGSSGIVDYYTADVVSYSDYYPYGMQMPNRNGTTGDYRYGFNGMEKDDEIKGSKNSYDYGARMLDPRIGRWLTIDPLARKYPMDSPYSAMGNNPIIMIDPNGQEKIVIVGSENRKWNLTFVLPAMKAAKKMAKSTDELVTMLIFEAGYTDKQLHRIKGFCQSQGIKFQSVTSADEVVTYINHQTTTGPSSTRNVDPVTNIKIFAHGLPGSIAFGYHQGDDIESKYSFDATDVSKISQTAMDPNAQITSYACRTGDGNGDTETGNVEPENSLAQGMADHLGVTVYALQRRSDYAEILPDDTRSYFDQWTDPDQTYAKDGGTWDTGTAIDKVSLPTYGESPSKSPGWTKFTEDKSPTICD